MMNSKNVARIGRVVALLAVGLLCTASPSSGQTLASDAHNLTALRQRHPCPDTLRIPVWVEARLAAYACPMVVAAVAEVAAGRARHLGIHARDLQKIERASIAEFTFKDLSGKVVQAYWSIALSIRDVDFAVGVDIDRTNGRLSVRKVERPL